MYIAIQKDGDCLWKQIFLLVVIPAKQSSYTAWIAAYAVVAENESLLSEARR